MSWCLSLADDRTSGPCFRRGAGLCVGGIPQSGLPQQGFPIRGVSERGEGNASELSVLDELAMQGESIEWDL